jgi:hypothetical protein
MARKSRFPVETLSSSLKTRFRNATVALDRPRKPTGKWFLDVALKGHSVAVQWKEDKGFGISSSAENAYGDGVDEVYMDEEAAFGRIVSLLLSGSFTSPPLAVTLRELRKEQGLSQTKMGEVLHKQQGEIASQSKSVADLNSLMRLMMKSAMERMLDTEMNVHLGRVCAVNVVREQVFWRSRKGALPERRATSAKLAGKRIHLNSPGIREFLRSMNSELRLFAKWLGAGSNRRHMDFQSRQEITNILM